MDYINFEYFSAWNVLIPPTPFSAVAKKGESKLFIMRLFPLFALAERGPSVKKQPSGLF